jgi:DNA-binding winged helix-turn-helix (wHTH) protein
MATHPVYDRILADLYEGGELNELESKVVDILKRADGEPVTRRDFIEEIFLYTPSRDLSNNSDDRKVRKAIESLRRKGATMIVSTFGSAGYCIDNSVERAEEMAAEMEKRARELNALAEKIRSALRPVEMPKEVFERAKPKAISQLSFVDA